MIENEVDLNGRNCLRPLWSEIQGKAPVAAFLQFNPPFYGLG
jgi:hypothetical protein